ncbi:MAG TPA: hypothetical protein VJ984_14885 [Xanthomonadales bacterium]|nr:hypothetical protein [Xanthomonadales bacterium]
MHKILLLLILGLLCCVISPVQASDETPPESQEQCDPESDEDCAPEDEDELDRGFDPCLINASLPACKPEAESGEPGAAERSPAETEGTDDSG